MAAILLAGAGFWRDDIKNLLEYGWGDWPTHESFEKCTWKKRTFSKITLFEQSCSDSLPQSQLSESNDGAIVQTQTTKYGYSFKLQLFTKGSTQKPRDIINEWYAKLTSEQQKLCEVQNADEPLQYFSDGKILLAEAPHPTPHKTRYKITIRPEVIEQIWNEYDGDPGSSPERDYMCGQVVGTTWGGHSPYFEFDDRSEEQYLLVGTYGQEGPPVDLNSIRF